MKKIISVVLTLLLCVGMLTPTFAANEKTAFVVVSGMNTFPLFDGTGTQVFPMTSDTIFNMVMKVLAPTTEYLITGNSKKFCDKTNPVVYDVFAPLACDENGDSIEIVRTVTFNGSLTECADTFYAEDSDELAVVRAGMDKFGVENSFFFNYDWRLDPLTHADALNEFIKNVKEITGCSRVAVAAFSMGGTVVCSYLYKYGSSDLASLQLCSTAFQGTSCVSDLFNGELKVDAEGLIRRLAQLTRNNTAENFIELLNLKLSLSGFNTNLSKIINGISDPALGRVYKEILIPVFGHMPGFWALVDGESYESAKAFMLGDSCKGLQSRIDEYHYNVQCNAEELLAKAMNDTNVYIIAQYNMQGLPISDRSTKSNNDYLIDAAFASGGAVCAKLGETLGADYVQAAHNDKNYLSPDGQIDASTCMFPDRTWFIRDMGHVDYPYGGGTELIIYLASSDEQITVDNGEYSQFLTYSYKTNTIAPVDGGLKKTFADKFFDFFKNILIKIHDLFAKLFKR